MLCGQPPFDEEQINDVCRALFCDQCEEDMQLAWKVNPLLVVSWWCLGGGDALVVVAICNLVVGVMLWWSEWSALLLPVSLSLSLTLSQRRYLSASLILPRVLRLCGARRCLIPREKVQSAPRISKSRYH